MRHSSYDNLFIRFGGNFLHSFAIIRQLQVFTIENRTHVNTQYRYPQFKLINLLNAIMMLSKG
jgi:hypothetical protein